MILPEAEHDGQREDMPEIPSIEGLATESYVDEQIASIPEPDMDSKQDKLTGTDTQIVSFDANGNAIAIEKPYAATIRVW